MAQGMGDLLKQTSKRWATKRDPRSGAWRIVDLWHDAIAAIGPDDEIPENCPALTILPADAFDSLISEADRLGLLVKYVGPAGAKNEKPYYPPETRYPQSSGNSREAFNHEERMEGLKLLREIILPTHIDRFTDE